MFDPNDPANSFLKGCQFAVPAHIVEPRLDKLIRPHARPRKIAVKVGDYHLDAYLFSPRHVKKNDAGLGFCVDTVFISTALGFTFKDDYLIETCEVSDRRLPLLVRPGQAAIHRPDQMTEAMRRALAVYEPLLCRFTGLTGLTPHFHCDGDEVIRAPLPCGPGEAHIFANARPPGEARSRFISSVAGLPIHDEGQEVICLEPAAGRGMTLGDESGTLVQTIGSNVYFLLPTMSNFDPLVSPRIFEYLLVLGWEGCRRHQSRPPEADRPARRKDFLACTKGWLETGRDLMVKDLAKVDANIESAQRWLAELLRSKRELEEHIQAIDATPFVQATLGRLPRDYRQIKAHPDVAIIAVVNDGIHVETRPLHVEHEGKRYAVGSFTIRIGRKGTVNVWCETPLHPKGVPHPHIAKDGGPCFGNATNAILRAGADHRYHDVVTLVLRWLKQGYSPQLASVKIEEWPLAGPFPSVDAAKAGEAKGGV